MATALARPTTRTKAREARPVARLSLDDAKRDGSILPRREGTPTWSPGGQGERHTDVASATRRRGLPTLIGASTGWLIGLVLGVVLGMQVAVSAAAPFLDLAGERVYFCSAGCRDAHAAQPATH